MFKKDATTIRQFENHYIILLPKLYRIEQYNPVLRSENTSNTEAVFFKFANLYQLYLF